MRSRSGLRLAHEGAHDSSQLRRAAQVTRSPASGVGVPVPGDAASRAAPIQPPLLLEGAPLVLRLASAPRTLRPRPAPRERELALESRRITRSAPNAGHRCRGSVALTL